MASNSIKGKLVEKEATTAVAKRPVTIMEEINALVPQFHKAMPSFLKQIGGPDRLARIALTEFRKNPQLALCTRESFFGALMTAAQMGLEPGPLGHCYLIPYKGTATLQLGYRGFLEFVQRSGKIDSVYAYPVFAGDEFTFELGAHPVLKHTPSVDSDPSDANMTHVYAVAHIKGCAIPRIEVMTRKQVEAIRNRSKAAGAGHSSPWDTDFSEMARKTVLKRLCKTLPLSIESQQFLSLDETARTRIAPDTEPVSMIDLSPRLDLVPEGMVHGTTDASDWKQTSMIDGAVELTEDDEKFLAGN